MKYQAEELMLHECYKILEERNDAAASLEEQLERASIQFEAARRALSLVNRLTPGETRGRHASRVMNFLNRIRSQMAMLSKTIEHYVVSEENE